MILNPLCGLHLQAIFFVNGTWSVSKFPSILPYGQYIDHMGIH